MLRMLSCLLVLAPGGRALAAGDRQLTVSPRAGEVFVWDSTSSPVHLTSADSSMQMPVLGVAADVRPWRELVVDGEVLFGTGATLDTPQVNPTRTGVGYRRVSLGLGWRLGLTGLGPLRAVVAAAGFGQERASADRQFMPGADHRQVTPSFTRDEPWLRATAEAALVDDHVALRVAVTAVPWGHVRADWATDGSNQYGWGFDFAARAEWGFGALLGSWGELGAGVSVDGGFRRVAFSGKGTRTNSQGTPVEDVRDRFSRLMVLGVVSWRLVVGAEPRPAPALATPASAAPVSDATGAPPAAPASVPEQPAHDPG